MFVSANPAFFFDKKNMFQKVTKKTAVHGLESKRSCVIVQKNYKQQTISIDFK